MDDIVERRIAIAEIKFAGKRAGRGTGKHCDVTEGAGSGEGPEQPRAADLKSFIIVGRGAAAGAIKGRAWKEGKLPGGGDAVGVDSSVNSKSGSVKRRAVRHASGVLDCTYPCLRDTSLGIHRIERSANYGAVAFGA